MDYRLIDISTSKGEAWAVAFVSLDRTVGVTEFHGENASQRATAYQGWMIETEKAAIVAAEKAAFRQRKERNRQPTMFRLQPAEHVAAFVARDRAARKQVAG